MQGPRSPGHDSRIAEYLRRIADPAESSPEDLPPGPPPKLYRVSEIAQHLNITRQTVHNYATIGLITEERRTPGGQRLFDESVFGRLMQVRQLKRTHLLHDIRRILVQQDARVAGGHAETHLPVETAAYLAASRRDDPATDAAPEARESPRPGSALPSTTPVPGETAVGPDIAVRVKRGKETRHSGEP